MAHACYVAVCGGGGDDDPAKPAAYAIGRGLAEAGVVVVCGGLGGVMAEACRGAKAGGGVTVGLLPGAKRGQANPWVDVAVPTGLGEVRNVLVVRAADAVVAIGGGWGTLSEIALALRQGTPVVGLGSWQLRQPRGRPPTGSTGLVRATDPADALRRVLRLAWAGAGGQRPG